MWCDEGYVRRRLGYFRGTGRTSSSAFAAFASLATLANLASRASRANLASLASLASDSAFAACPSASCTRSPLAAATSARGEGGADYRPTSACAAACTIASSHARRSATSRW